MKKVLLFAMLLLPQMLVAQEIYNTYLKDGKDMKNAVSYLMGDTTGYAAVHISAEGYPDDVIWCHYPITVDDIDDLTKIVSMKKDEIYYDTVVGRYPDEIVMK